MRDRWTEAPLAAVATRVTEKNRNLLDKVFTVSAEYGLIDQETFFNKRVASKNLLGYTVVQPGMLVYNKSYSVTAPYGVITRNHHEHPGVVSPLYLVFSPQEDKVLGTYLELAANSATFFNSLKKSIKEGGRAHGGITISLTDFFGSEIPLAPIAEQKRIVDVVSSVDAYIDALQQQAAMARTARNAVLHELLTAGGDDWTETTLGAVAILNPKASALSKDAPFVPMDAVKVGQRFVTYSEPRGERSGARANSDDVLFARITPCLENGKVAQIQPELGACGGSTEFIVIRGSEKISADFIYFWATWSEVRKTATGLMTGTTGRQRLSANDLAAIQILLPPIAEQKQIVDIVSSMDDVTQTAERAVVEAKNLRSGLLSDLLSGEHEIPVSYDAFLEAA